MRFKHFTRQLSAPSLACTLPLCLLLCGAVQAQTPASPPPAPSASSPTVADKQAPEQATQRIVVEDASTRIDEVRVGGETKSITVKPKDGMPAYDVAPATGERTWKVLGF
ncbi:hypothetical protein LHU53_07450 [Rhodoferax sp. U2-2l]|uniref:hypothetical protein n=1 Tax=Rhodoferax sp. U2-2l TaxID=2884000 RepID=UPI001D0BC1EE|nr:hypothetical protein [Rhodoferax sp. U2-2l]MCB8746741.1 hypothetical protein [Rhodoferax sp. U2-2l]